jgi:DNA-binding MarR family transcriptional regulator
VSAPRLDDQLCFATYTASRLIVRMYQPILKELKLTYPQYLVMMVLWEWDDADGQSRSVSELGQRLYLDSGTLTPLLKRLETAGRVVRSRSVQDGRTVQLSLTDAGRQLADEAAKVQAMLLCSFEGEMDAVVRLREAMKHLVQRLASGHL